MIKRTIDISVPAYVHLKNKQLLIKREMQDTASIPVEDIGVLILEHPAIAFTQSAVIACQKNNVAVIFCDEKRLPYSLLLPISKGHTLHSKILKEQLKATKPIKKRIWKQIIQEKIYQQIKTLEAFNKDSIFLQRLRLKVKSGDSENYEAQAAKIYWPLLMGAKFRRNPNVEGTNTLLNYGYAIIRSLIARSIVSGGLHPAIGLHHRNQYNGLALADDLMEPFRPWIDYRVRLFSEKYESSEINKESKRELLDIISTPVLFKKKEMPFMVASHRLVTDLKQALTGNIDKLLFPRLRK